MTNEPTELSFDKATYAAEGDAVSTTPPCGNCGRPLADAYWKWHHMVICSTCPGFGALIRMNQYPTDAHEEARTGLAGPLWGLVAACAALAIGKWLGSGAALGVASLGATINMFNLIPVWQLDGARGLKALSRPHRVTVAVVAVLAAVAFHQVTPLIVGVVVAARAFEKTSHPEGDRGMLALYAALVVALSAIATNPVPGLGDGSPLGKIPGFG